MKKNIFLATLFSVVLIGVSGALAPASALTVDELQTQIKELLAKVAELTKQMNALKADPAVSGTTNANSGTASPSKHRICAILNRNLSMGAQGDDVRGLQEFLYEQKLLTVSPTGYFGQMTADAVKHWQTDEGVQAVGAFGPMSRERIKVWCGGGWNNTERFSATPSRGEAPLAVVFDTWLSGFRVQSVYFTIDFGDGSSERAADCYAPADACQSPGQNKHTYSSNGMYTATLNKITDPCAGQLACKAAIQSEVVGKTQIYVGSTACTKEYVPVCGSKPIVCITTPCNPIPQTYGNRCMMNADGASFLYEGQCKDTSGNKPPVVSSFSGPTTLAVNASGTWTIQASDPENQSLKYSITWGDEYKSLPPYASATAQESFVQTSTFTHAYASAGTYTVVIVVTDASGAQAKTSTTVKVGSETTACTMDAMQCSDGSYVGRTGSKCEFVCPTTTVSCTNSSGPVCAKTPNSCFYTDPAPSWCAGRGWGEERTYANRCDMEAAHAEFVRAGSCT